MNAWKAMGLDTLKGRIIRYVNCISIKMLKKKVEGEKFCFSPLLLSQEAASKPSVASFSDIWKETVCYTCKEVLCISYFYHQRCRLDTLF